MSKYDSLFKKTEVFEKLAIFAKREDFLKSLSEATPHVPTKTNTSNNQVIDKVVYPETKEDTRYDTEGFQPHDEMIDQTEDEADDLPQEWIVDNKKPVFAALDKLKYFKKYY